MRTLLLFFLLSTSVVARAVPPPETDPIKENFDEELLPDATSYNKELKNRYSLFLHKRTYLLPITYNWKTHEEIYRGLPALSPKTDPFYQNKEAEFQISFFIPAYREVFGSDWDLLFAYTHHSWWQVYNSAWSKAFRETNYMPEIYFRKVNKDPLRLSLFDAIALDVGLIHQSNGQIQLVSRSWDRAFARAYFVTQTMSVSLALWARLPEKPDQDENRNITRYMGHGEITALKTFGIHTLEVKMPFSERPGLEVHYSYPWYGNLRLFMMGQVGYGHSLIEYNKETQRIGIGITLENFIDKKKSAFTVLPAP